MKQLNNLYQKAIEASIKASEVIMEYYQNGFNSNLKIDGSPVTEADLASSQIILNILEETNIPILSEESVHQNYEERKDWTLNWCVDPLDGTKEYIKRNGEFAVCIALIENGKSIFGVIASPVNKTILFGGKECNSSISTFDNIDNPNQWIELESVENINDPIVMISSRSHPSNPTANFIDELKEIHENIHFIHKGSALKFFDLAEGKADVYPRFAPTMEWDIAAGQAILENLGGEVISLDTNQPLTYNKESLFNSFFVAKTKALLSLISVFCFCFSFSQNNTLPIHSYFKDKLFRPQTSKTYIGNSFLPITENYFNLHKVNADSSIQYYDFTETVFKHHLIEIKGDGYNLSISPLVDISRGKNRADTVKIPPRYYNNTRGILIEGDVTSKFSFSTSIYENQSLFLDYEKAYYNSLGEIKLNSANNYYTENATIPGASRTKPFKISGYDYSYAFGNIVYTPFKKLQFIAGNNTHFIGAGYRSLLLSDNSVNSPYFQINYQITKKLSFVYMRQKMLNQIRKMYKTTAEANFEPKGFSVNYLTYKPIENLSISFFEGIQWSKGDSIATHQVDPMFYNPLPGITNQIINDSSVCSTLLGLNVETVLFKNYRIYSQLAASNSDFEHFAFQLGLRAYDLFKLPNLMIQIEYNNVPNTIYKSTYSRLNYSNYNIALAHPKGNGFEELVLRANYEYNRIYLDYKSVFYQFHSRIENDLLPITKPNLIASSKQVFHHQIEIGYRFNRLLNLTIFGAWLKRVDYTSDKFPTDFINIGLRTGLVNHYNDF